jgi:hypothetical protein
VYPANVNHLQRLRARFSPDSQTVQLLDWIAAQPAASVYSHHTLADVLGVDTRRIGQILGNMAHVQNFHNLAALVRIGRGSEGGVQVSLWQVQA